MATKMCTAAVKTKFVTCPQTMRGRALLPVLQSVGINRRQKNDCRTTAAFRVTQNFDLFFFVWMNYRKLN